MKKAPYTGQCLCGSIHYEVDDISAHMAHCHCRMCRKFHGAAFSTYGEAKREDFRWTKGESLLKTYQASNGTVRRFCDICGSSLTFAPAEYEGQFIEFSLGTLDSDLQRKPDAHIFVGSKASWVTISDDLPQFKKGR